jgi:hypothetical protein
MTSTAVTNVVERSHGGMPDWALLGVGVVNRKLKTYWPYISDVDGKRFLTRFIFIRNPLFSVDITRIHGADDQRAYPHDHSRTFISWKLTGGYEEDVYTDKDDLRERFHKKHGWMSFHKMSRHHAHSITRVSPHLVTVLFLGRKRQKSNYWTPEGLQSTGMGVDQDEWQ